MTTDGPDCFDEALLDAIASSTATSRDLERAVAHAADCEACAELLAVVARAKGAIHDSTVEDGPAGEILGPLPGQMIGRFVVQRVVGRGGMGVVVAATDPTLDRTVAIKVLRREGSAAPLLREARATANVRHPNVVTVHEVDRDRGRVFLVMDYVEGATLRHWLKERRPPWPGIVRMFIDAGKGLAAAHERGLVHRDFKPDNVLVGDDGVPQVIDFGLVSAWGDTTVAFTAGETIAGGTPRYMAPECHEGTDGTPASDQYAFCVALFEALLDVHPFWQRCESTRPRPARPFDRAFAPPPRQAPPRAGGWAASGSKATVPGHAQFAPRTRARPRGASAPAANPRRRGVGRRGRLGHRMALGPGGPGSVRVAR